MAYPTIKRPPKSANQVPGGIGGMRQLVTLQSPTQVRNDFGEMVGGWHDEFVDDFARVESLTGRELTTAQQVQADATGRVTMRYRPGVTPAWRVLFEGRPLNILDVGNPEERDVVLVLLTSEYQT